MKTLLDSLTEAVNAAPAGAAQDELRIEWACCMARYGRVEEARATYQEIWQRYRKGSNPRTSILLIVLDAVVAYYSDRSSSCVDRIWRAQALASRLSSIDLLLAAASWSALFAYNFDDFERLGDALSTCAKGFSEMDKVAQTRVSLVIADSLQFAGDWASASVWYSGARRSARETHDHAALCSIEFNRLAAGLSRRRAEYFLNLSPSGDESRGWSLELDSVINLHAGVMSQSLMHLLTLARLRICQQSDEFRDAAALVESLRRESAPEASGLTEIALKIECAWCRWRGGLAVVGFEMHQEDWRSIETLDADDQIACYEMLSDLANADLVCCGEADVVAGRHSARARYEERIELLKSSVAGPDLALRRLLVG